jgi:hypothetical protein
MFTFSPDAALILYISTDLKQCNLRTNITLPGEHKAIDFETTTSS